MSNFYITPEQYKQAEKNGISKSVVTERVRARGWNIERAITTPVRQIRRGISEYVKKAKENGISSTTFHSRINLLGWSIEDAATIPIINLKKYSDEVYIKLEKNKISTQLLRNRLNSGWDFETAISTSPRKYRNDV